MKGFPWTDLGWFYTRERVTTWESWHAGWTFLFSKISLASWSHSSNISKLLILNDTNYSQNSPTIFFVLNSFPDIDTFPISTPQFNSRFLSPLVGNSFKHFSYLICVKWILHYTRLPRKIFFHYKVLSVFFFVIVYV